VPDVPEGERPPNEPPDESKEITIDMSELLPYENDGNSLDSRSMASLSYISDHTTSVANASSTTQSLQSDTVKPKRKKLKDMLKRVIY
jgi:hypothetical protein